MWCFLDAFEIPRAPKATGVSQRQRSFFGKPAGFLAKKCKFYPV